MKKSKKSSKKKRSRKQLSFRTILLSISAGLLTGSGVVVLFLFLQHTPNPAPREVIIAQADPDHTLVNKEIYPTTEPTTEPPTEPVTYEMQLDMQKVQDYHAANPDVIGWVYIQDTPINYPVVQGDDNYFYLDKNWKGEYSFSGSIFADYQCKIDTSENSLFYGHNMGNGTMFHGVKYYRDEEWGKEHLYFEVASLGKRYLYRALSVNVIYGEEGADFEYWNYVEMTEDEYNRYVRKIHETSTVWYGDTEHIPKYDRNRLIVLQTCNSGAHDGMRCVLFGYCVGER